VDYLLKPVEGARLAAAIEHARERLQNKAAPKRVAAHVSRSRTTACRKLERIVIRNEGQVQVIPNRQRRYTSKRRRLLKFFCGQGQASQATNR